MANEEHLAKLNEGVEAWNKWREDNPAIIPDLEGAILHRTNLSEANLSGAYLSGAKLEGAILHRTNLSGAKLEGANLSGAKLEGADLSEADLSADLSTDLSADPEGAILHRTNLSGADLSGADLSGADLGGAILHRTKLEGADLSKADLSADLSAVDLSEADLSKAKLSHANLSGSNFSKADLSGANLSGADLSEANLSAATLPGADLGTALLHRTNLSGADLSGTDLGAASLGAAILHGAILHEADLSGAMLHEADLSGAMLHEADLGETLFVNVDLSETIGLEKCRHLATSTIDHRTLAMSKDLPVEFLQGAGLPEERIRSYLYGNALTIEFAGPWWTSVTPIEFALQSLLGDGFSVEKEGNHITVWLETPDLFVPVLNVTVSILSALESTYPNQTTRLKVQPKGEDEEVLEDTDLKKVLEGQQKIFDRLDELDAKKGLLVDTFEKALEGIPGVGPLFSMWFERLVNFWKHSVDRDRKDLRRFNQSFKQIYEGANNILSEPLKQLPPGGNEETE